MPIIPQFSWIQFVKRDTSDGMGKHLQEAHESFHIGCCNLPGL